MSAIVSLGPAVLRDHRRTASAVPVRSAALRRPLSLLLFLVTQNVLGKMMIIFDTFCVWPVSASINERIWLKMKLKEPGRASFSTIYVSSSTATKDFHVVTEEKQETRKKQNTCRSLLINRSEWKEKNLTTMIKKKKWKFKYTIQNLYCDYIPRFTVYLGLTVKYFQDTPNRCRISSVCEHHILHSARSWSWAQMTAFANKKKKKKKKLCRRSQLTRKRNQHINWFR